MFVTREVGSRQLIEAGAQLDAWGMVPATSGNFSVRLNTDSAWVTASGRHKGRLTTQDFLEVDLQGQPVESNSPRPSAETLLHTSIYKHFPHIGAVLHTHSVNATVLSRLLSHSPQLVLEGYELQKAFPGVTTHQSQISIPMFPNTQDMQALSQDLEARLKQGQNFFGFLICGHGLYTWAEDVPATMRHLEAFEFLFACELKMRSLSP